MFFWVARQARSSDPAVRKRAAEKLAAGGRSVSREGRLPRHVGLLLELASDTSVEVRLAAYDALARVADARAAEPMAAGLRTTDKLDESAAATLRDGAARAFQGIGVEALPVLLGLVADRNPRAREAAVVALGGIGGADAEHALVAALQDSRSNVRQLAARALARSAAAGPIGSLSAALQHRDPATRRCAVEAMTGMKGEDAVRALARLTADPDRSVRESAVRTLAALASPGAIDVLLAVFRGQDRELRQQAAAALKELSWEPVTPAQRALRAILGGDYRAAAVEGEAAVEPLAAAFADKSPAVRRAATEALGLTAHAAAVAPLLSSLQDPDAAVRQAASDGLARIGAPAVVPLASAVHETVQTAAPDILLRIGAPAVPPLLDLLEQGETIDHDGARLRRVEDDARGEALARAAHLLGRVLGHAAGSVETPVLARATRLVDLVTVREIMPASRRENVTTVVDVVADCKDLRGRAATELARRK